MSNRRYLHGIKQSLYKNKCYDDPSMLGGVSSLLLQGLGGAGGAAIPALPLIEGGVSLIGGLIKQNQASKLKAQTDRPDPELSKYMGEIDRQRRSFASGSAYNQEMRELKNQQSATQLGVLRAAKGNTGAALNAIQQVGLNTQLGYGKIAAQGQARQDEYSQMYGSLLQRMEERKHAEAIDTYNQKNIDARDQKVKGLQTLLNTAALSKVGGGGGIADLLKNLMPQGGGNPNLGGAESAIGLNNGSGLGNQSDIQKLISNGIF